MAAPCRSDINVDIQGSTFFGNTAIVRTFLGNIITGTGYGGAIQVTSSATLAASLTGSILGGAFANNSATLGGASFYCDDCMKTFTVASCEFQGGQSQRSLF